MYHSPQLLWKHLREAPQNFQYMSYSHSPQHWSLVCPETSSNHCNQPEHALKTENGRIQVFDYKFTTYLNDGECMQFRSKWKSSWSPYSYQPGSIFNLLLWNSHVRNYEHVQWKALKEICWWCCWQNLFSRYLVTTPDPGARLVFTHGCTCSVHILIQNVLWLQ